MTAASRGGRRANQPDTNWQPPERLPAGGAVTSVCFIEETGGRSKTFDFAKLGVDVGLQQWFARVFARLTGPRSGVKRLTSAKGHYNLIHIFAASLAASFPTPRGPQDLTACHIEAFRRRYDNMPAQYDYVKRLRVVLRDEPELPQSARHELLAARLPDKPEPAPASGYSDGEWQQLMTALRHDVRVARDRVRAGRDLLTRYRAQAVAPGSDEDELGRLLDIFDRTGDLPRTASGGHSRAVGRAGGFRAVGIRLCIDHGEAVAFCLLLTALTAENYGTVTRWPAVHVRPDGSHTDSGVALLEESKPRRGPEREHMVTALEDAAPGLAETLNADGDPRLFRSPLRVYRLLLELTEVARRVGGHTTAVSVFAPTPGRHGTRFSDVMRGSHVVLWARHRQFPAACDASPDTKPPVNVNRIRRTAIEHRRHPVAHTRQTMNDEYLKRSRTVQADSRTVVADALREQVDKARTQQSVTVFTADFVARARQDPRSAAAEAGLEAEALVELINGGRDTALASCTDHLTSPHGEAGQPCPASFLTCLGCANARALPHHLPVQLAVRDRIRALRPHMDAALWRFRYEQTLDRLDDIAGHYTSAETEQARRALTPHRQRLVDDLIDGRMDLR